MRLFDIVNKIDGFAINCGKSKRIIFLENNIYTIGCFKGTYEEAVKAIRKKYKGKEADDYIQKLDDCKSMKWADLEKLKDDENPEIRIMVASFSDKYHSKLKDDKDWRVREAVAKYSDKYHWQFKDDKDPDVRLVVAKYSDKYHQQFKDDKCWVIRKAVAEYSDRYHYQLKNDNFWMVRRAVINYKIKNC